MYVYMCVSSSMFMDWLQIMYNCKYAGFYAFFLFEWRIVPLWISASLIFIFTTKRSRKTLHFQFLIFGFLFLFMYNCVCVVRRCYNPRLKAKSEKALPPKLRMGVYVYRLHLAIFSPHTVDKNTNHTLTEMTTFSVIFFWVKV